MRSSKLFAVSTACFFHRKCPKNSLQNEKSCLLIILWNKTYLDIKFLGKFPSSIRATTSYRSTTLEKNSKKSPNVFHFVVFFLRRARSLQTGNVPQRHAKLISTATITVIAMMWSGLKSFDPQPFRSGRFIVPWKRLTWICPVFLNGASK